MYKYVIACIPSLVFIYILSFHKCEDVMLLRLLFTSAYAKKQKAKKLESEKKMRQSNKNCYSHTLD